MRSLGRAGALVAGVLAVALLAGCAEPGSASAPTFSRSVPPSVPPTPLGGPLVAPGHDAVEGGGTPARLTVHRTATPAGVRVGPAWRVRSASGTRLEIGWFDRPSAACGAATDVWLSESRERVVVDLSGHGVRPNVLCAAILAPRRAVLRLARPLGGRRLLEHRPAAGGAR